MGHKKQNDIWKQCHLCKTEGCPDRATNSNIKRTDCDQFGVLKKPWQGKEEIDGSLLKELRKKGKISFNGRYFPEEVRQNILASRIEGN